MQPVEVVIPRWGWAADGREPDGTGHLGPANPTAHTAIVTVSAPDGGIWNVGLLRYPLNGVETVEVVGVVEGGTGAAIPLEWVELLTPAQWEGRRLRALRGDRSQEAIATAAGARQPHIAAWEAGTRALGQEMRLALAEALGCSPDTFTLPPSGRIHKIRPAYASMA